MPGLFVALAVVTALVGFYAGMSTSTPQALADPLADPAGSSVDVTRTDGIDRGAGAQGTGYLTIAAIDIGSN